MGTFPTGLSWTFPWEGHEGVDTVWVSLDGLGAVGGAERVLRTRQAGVASLLGETAS